MRTISESPIPIRRTETITTTLYDLIEAVNTALGPENEDLVVATVADILRRGRARFVHKHMGHVLWN
jgi:hypothetical protein